MVYCIQANLAFRNTARRDTVSANIQTKIATWTPWEPVLRRDYTTRAGDPAVRLEVRFLTQAEQQAAWTDLQASVGTGVNGPIAGSFFARHDCPHDQGQAVACIDAERVNF